MLSLSTEISPRSHRRSNGIVSRDLSVLLICAQHPDQICRMMIVANNKTAVQWNFVPFFVFFFFFYARNCIFGPTDSSITFDGDNKTARRVCVFAIAQPRLAVCLTVSLLCVVIQCERIAKRETENQETHTHTHALTLISCSEHRGTRVPYRPVIREPAFDSTTNETTVEYSPPRVPRETSRTNEIPWRGSREIDERERGVSRSVASPRTDLNLAWTSLNTRSLGSR